jgi:hypothetical protein
MMSLMECNKGVDNVGHKQVMYQAKLGGFLVEGEKHGR